MVHLPKEDKSGCQFGCVFWRLRVPYMVLKEHILCIIRKDWLSSSWLDHTCE